MSNRKNNMSVKQGRKGFEGSNNDASGALDYVKRIWSPHTQVSHLVYPIEIIQKHGSAEQWSELESHLDLLKQNVDIQVMSKTLNAYSEAMDFDETILYRFGDEKRSRTDRFKSTAIERKVFE